MAEPTDELMRLRAEHEAALLAHWQAMKQVEAQGQDPEADYDQFHDLPGWRAYQASKTPLAIATERLAEYLLAQAALAPGAGAGGVDRGDGDARAI